MTQIIIEPTGSTDLPLIRLSLALPLIEEVERHGFVIHDLLNALSLSRGTIFSSDLFVPASVMYSLL
jgi:hypothetical protein